VGPKSNEFSVQQELTVVKLEWRLKETRMNIKERKCEEMGRVQIPQGQLAGSISRNTGFTTSRF
jgi:hypothetical protein